MSRDGWFDGIGVDLSIASARESDTWKKYMADGVITSDEFSAHEKYIHDKLVALEDKLDDPTHAAVGEALREIQVLVEMYKVALAFVAEAGGLSKPAP